jgi:hypothetical protein
MKQTVGALLAILVLTSFAIAAGDGNSASPKPAVSVAVKFAQTPPLRQMGMIPPQIASLGRLGLNLRERGAVPPDNGYRGDGALQTAVLPAAMPSPLFTFEGPANQDNFDIFGFRVTPPDPNGDVGPNHYVTMVNLTFAIYSKQGALLFGPADIGSLWQGFLDDCTDPSGDPIVFYDSLADRWVLTQFTTRGPEFFNCVALSTTSDPLGSYFLYAFSTGLNFPDYPKYALWPDAYYITTREFDPSNNESIGIYAVDRKQMLNGKPTPRMVSFHLASPAYLVGDGLLAAHFNGTRIPPPGSPEYVVGTMDDGASDGAPFDGLNIFEARINFARPDTSTFTLAHQLPISSFDTIFPCTPRGGRDCIPQPGTSRKIDILSYRQRPIWRLQYRNFGDHESLVTNQSVEAFKGVAGVRWWEIRSPQNPVLYQDSTWAPSDGVHRWMGSAAMDKQGNMAVGYSVSNGDNVFPGIRYAGRLADDPLNTLGQGEAVLQDGSGSQLSTGSRWGDYTALNVDPADGCTFYYINEYYTVTATSLWHTRIGAFKFPGCQ